MVAIGSSGSNKYVAVVAIGNSTQFLYWLTNTTANKHVPNLDNEQ